MNILPTFLFYSSQFLFFCQSTFLTHWIICSFRLSGGLSLPNFLIYYWAAHIHELCYWLKSPGSSWCKLELEDLLYLLYFIPLYLQNPLYIRTIKWFLVKSFNLYSTFKCTTVDPKCFTGIAGKAKQYTCLENTNSSIQDSNNIVRRR